jgi:hypothetical protein
MRLPLYLHGRVIAYALLDDSDYQEQRQHRWRLKNPSGNGRGYAFRKKAGRMIYLHREVLGLAPGTNPLVDHIDGDGLNCIRSNLRRCTRAQNTYNTKRRASNRSGIKGVYWHRSAKKWAAAIQIGGKSRYLGCYVDKIEAGAAYASEARKLHGQFFNPG